MRGYFGIGIYHAKKEVNVGTLMRSAFCFGASFVFTIGRRYRPQASDTVSTISTVPCYHYDNFDQFKSHQPLGCRIVGVEIADKARPVGEYCHPDQAVYLLGAEDYGIPPRDMARCHDVVVIPDTSHCLNVSVAGSIVMYDRGRHFRTRPIPPRRAAA